MAKQAITADLHQTRILVVDDHPATAEMLARAISQLGAGIEILSATSGKMALEQVSDGAVDLLITDMMMPGMNGLELIEQLNALPGGRPAHIILITAYDVPGLRETAKRLNVNETILKPIRPERICQIVGNVISTLGHAAVPLSTGDINSLKILIADDSPDNVTLLSRYMKNEGYRCITASNGLEALQKTRTESPDLVLLDVNMPEMDGFKVLEEIRTDPAVKNIPVIIFTAARQHPEDVQSGLNLGADDYITKPFDKRELFARIRTKLRVKQAEDEILRRNRELSVLPEIGKDISARLDIHELLSVVLRRSAETFGAFLAHAVIFKPEGTPLQKSFSTFQKKDCTDMQYPHLEGFLSQIEESGQGQIVDDVQNDLRWQVIPDDPTRSIAVAPMLGRDHLLGLLMLAHERAQYFTRDHLVLLQAIASQAAIAVENAQLYAYMAQEQERLAVVLQNAADAIMMFDENGCLSLLNHTGQELFSGYQPRLGQPLKRGAGYDSFVELLEEALLSGSARSCEIFWPDKRTFTASITPIHQGGYIVILHDVSYFRNLERVKNEFIATVSHDLKSPITAIAGFSNLFLQAGNLNDRQSDFISRIQSAATSMNELVENMLALAKKDLDNKPRQEIVDIAALLAKTEDEFHALAKARKQIFHFKYLTAPLNVMGDALKLRHAVSNLVANAIKYTPSGGSITVSYESDGDTVSIHVEDTGCGIPAADLPYIFDHFYRARSKETEEIEGNGLGLAIVKSVVEGHGGQVSAQSEPGKGACFTFTLPLMGISDNIKSTGNSNLTKESAI